MASFNSILFGWQYKPVFERLISEMLDKPLSSDISAVTTARRACYNGKDPVLIDLEGLLMYNYRQIPVHLNIWLDFQDYLNSEKHFHQLCEILHDICVGILFKDLPKFE